jgi:hypothetical protein
LPPEAKSTLVLLGSARQGGNTHQAVDRLLACMDPRPTLVDLQRLHIEPFGYERQGQDDFRGVIDQILRHRRVVFATPVYWYAMSGLMKTFFDRLTDLLLDPQSRPLGRSLAGREIWLLATGTDDSLPPGFAEPFARTADYFDMQWQRAFYVRIGKAASPAAQDFGPAEQLGTALRAGI